MPEECSLILQVEDSIAMTEINGDIFRVLPHQPQQLLPRQVALAPPVLAHQLHQLARHQLAYQPALPALALHYYNENN